MANVVFQCNESDEGLARDLLDAADFAAYFAASPAVKSTPHLYISALATWQRDVRLIQVWKAQFSHFGPTIILKEGSVKPSSVSSLVR